MKKISITKAKEKITEYARQNFSEFYNHEEFPAAITHWLHNSHIRPPFMAEEVFQKLHNLFSL
jgi:hypothetical protein